MSRLTVYDMKGAAKGEVEVVDSLLVLRSGQQAVQDTVVGHRAASRGGNASTLGKGGVAGSNKKPWRQKGTGQARAGYRRSPIWRGGGVAFGPQPHDYDKKVSKKTRRLAFRRVLSEKIAGGFIRVMETLEFSEPKTRHMVSLLNALNIQGPALVVLDKHDENVARAARNITNLEVVVAASLDTYHVLRYPVMIVTKDAMNCLRERLQTVA